MRNWKNRSVLSLGIFFLSVLWVAWGAAIYYAALQLEKNNLPIPGSLAHVANYATSFGCWQVLLQVLQ